MATQFFDFAPKEIDPWEGTRALTALYGTIRQSQINQQLADDQGVRTDIQNRALDAQIADQQSTSAYRAKAQALMESGQNLEQQRFQYQQNQDQQKFQYQQSQDTKANNRADLLQQAQLGKYQQEQAQSQFEFAREIGKLAGMKSPQVDLPDEKQLQAEAERTVDENFSQRPDMSDTVKKQLRRPAIDAYVQARVQQAHANSQLNLQENLLKVGHLKELANTDPVLMNLAPAITDVKGPYAQVLSRPGAEWLRDELTQMQRDRMIPAAEAMGQGPQNFMNFMQTKGQPNVPNQILAAKSAKWREVTDRLITDKTYDIEQAKKDYYGGATSPTTKPSDNGNRPIKVDNEQVATASADTEIGKRVVLYTDELHQDPETPLNKFINETSYARKAPSIITAIGGLFEKTSTFVNDTGATKDDLTRADNRLSAIGPQVVRKFDETNGRRTGLTDPDTKQQFTAVPNTEQLRIYRGLLNEMAMAKNPEQVSANAQKDRYLAAVFFNDRNAVGLMENLNNFESLIKQTESPEGQSNARKNKIRTKDAKTYVPSPVFY